MNIDEEIKKLEEQKVKHQAVIADYKGYVNDCSLKIRRLERLKKEMSEVINSTKPIEPICVEFEYKDFKDPKQLDIEEVIYPWKSSVSYDKGDKAHYEGLVYISSNPNNLGNPPDGDNLIWRLDPNEGNQPIIKDRGHDDYTDIFRTPLVDNPTVQDLVDRADAIKKLIHEKSENNTDIDTLKAAFESFDNMTGNTKKKLIKAANKEFIKQATIVDDDDPLDGLAWDPKKLTIEQIESLEKMSSPDVITTKDDYITGPKEEPITLSSIEDFLNEKE